MDGGMTAELLTAIPTIDDVLDEHAAEIGADRRGYGNHVYRVVNLCAAMAGTHGDRLEKMAIAGVFHDLGIWTAGTFDYLAPSVELARLHLARRGLTRWAPEITAMILEHHKITAVAGDDLGLVEAFRRADWIDVSFGRRRFGLDRRVVAAVRGRWPDAGFHYRLVQLSARRLVTHPLSPLPMMRW